MEAVAGTPYRVVVAASAAPTLEVYDASLTLVQAVSMTAGGGGFYYADVTLSEGVFILKTILAGRLMDTGRLYVRTRTHFETSDFVRRLLSGTKRVVGTKLIIYDEDNTTPLISWDLYDDTGAPVSVNPMEARRD